MWNKQENRYEYSDNDNIYIYILIRVNKQYVPGILTKDEVNQALCAHIKELQGKKRDNKAAMAKREHTRDRR